jgi:hypothetical protein
MKEACSYLMACAAKRQEAEIKNARHPWPVGVYLSFRMRQGLDREQR